MLALLVTMICQSAKRLMCATMFVSATHGMGGVNFAMANAGERMAR